MVSLEMGREGREREKGRKRGRGSQARILTTF
jgi:hypothetical protein